MLHTRQVLNTTLMPHLSAAMLACCDERPSDPIAFLEAFLRKKSADLRNDRKFLRFGPPNSRQDCKERHKLRMEVIINSLGTI